MTSLLTLDRVSLVLPDGTPLFVDLSLSVGRERVGLVGRNGSGKSTLLRCIAGQIAPSAGSVLVTDERLLVQQRFPDEATVGELLGASNALARLERIEEGRSSDVDLAEADWTLPERIANALAEMRLTGIDVTRRAAELSGGERVRVAIAGGLLARPDLLLMDEPTNDLDRHARADVIGMIERWRGAVVVASHDRELLEVMDRTVELSPVGCHVVGGGWTAFERDRDARRARARDELARAADARRATAQTVQRQRERKARRDKAGRAYAAKDIEPRMYLHAQSQRAERSAARDTDLGERLMTEADARLAEARSDVEVIAPLHIDLPTTRLPSDRRVLEMRNATFVHPEGATVGPWTIELRGPERVALTGPNGAGKSTMLRLAAGLIQPTRGTVRAFDELPSLLDQHVSLLDDGKSVVENVREHNPELSLEQAHAVAARFGFRAAAASKPCGILSGGERMRVALACVTGGSTPNQLLMLDEPTNHLDLDAVETLEAGLRSYDGALLIASHDSPFLDRIGITRRVELGQARPAGSEFQTS